MVTQQVFFDMALGFDGTEQVPHFERTAFKVMGKRMFATYLEIDHTANIFLTPQEQEVFCSIDPAHICPVANKWGEKGATTFYLNHVAIEILQEALWSAYRAVVDSKKSPGGKKVQRRSNRQ